MTPNSSQQRPTEDGGMSLDQVRTRISQLTATLDAVKEIIGVPPQGGDAGGTKPYVDDLMKDCKLHKEFLDNCTEFLLEGSQGAHGEEHEVLFQQYLDINDRYIGADGRSGLHSGTRMGFCWSVVLRLFRRVHCWKGCGQFTLVNAAGTSLDILFFGPLRPSPEIR